jgi:hypothetical protein
MRGAQLGQPYSADFAYVGPVWHRRVMPSHKYKIGQRVSYRPPRSNFPSRCVFTALLPGRAVDEFKYRIRRDGSAEDLFVNEGDLREARDR